jgi:iron(III) transport system ATP-binding protein
LSLEFSQIAHDYGNGHVLHAVDLEAPRGAITCLLGSSGCGKSTLLGLAAGLLRVQRGEVRLDGEVLADKRRNPAPEKRPVGLVFQDGALFPHMTLARNVAFGMPRAKQAAIDALLAQVGLAGLGGRYPHALSGGQQQRGALARALAAEPSVLLMDEPFANLDIVLRRALRRECRSLLRQRGTTTVLVTHDPDDALDIADRIAVMDAGRIVQVGTPLDLFERPATAAIGAMFAGAQVLFAQRTDAGLATPFGLWPMESVAGAVPDTAALELIVHARGIDLSEDAQGSAISDRREWSGGERVTLEGEGGAQLICDVTAHPGGADRYRAMPRRGAVRAFARE